MIEDKNCPKCNEPTESGATFCGNCGFRLIEPSTQQYLGVISAQQTTEIPSYAQPRTHHMKHWAALAIVFGVAGIASSVLLPFMGIALGIVGIILISTSFSVTRGWLKPAGLIISILAILVGLGFWVNTILHNPKLQSIKQPSSTGGVATISVSTPCYSITFKTIVNIDNSKGSCSVNAYNGSSFQNSTNIYKIVASNVSDINASNLSSFSKQAIAKDIAEHLPGYAVTSQNSSTFDGNPAYSVYAYDQSSNIAMIEETVLNTSTEGQNASNFFVIIHAVNGQIANLNSLEAGWQWNE